MQFYSNIRIFPNNSTAQFFCKFAGPEFAGLITTESIKGRSAHISKSLLERSNSKGKKSFANVTFMFSDEPHAG